MAPRNLTFATTLTPDPPLQQTARYTLDSADRQSIDNQIRATQTFLAADVINANSGTYALFVGDAGAVGDIVCSAGGLGGKPTVQLASSEALALSGVMFGILAEACVEGNKAHVIHSGIVGPEITGLAAGDEGWVRVNGNRCEKVSVLSDEDICVGWVDPGGFLRIGSQPIASVTGAAPTNAKYTIAAATVPAELTQAVAAQGLSSTYLFASESVAPLELRRTDSATAADVDVGYAEALSSGTTAAGFGPAWRFYAKKGAGGSETTGTLSLVWTSVTNSAEASKLVVKTRAGGAAPATALEVSTTAAKITALAGSGTRFVTVDSSGALGAQDAVGADASAKYLEDTTSAVNTDGIPTRQMSSMLTFGLVGDAGTSSGPLALRRLNTGGAAGTAGTAIELPFYLQDSTPSQRQVGRIRYEWTDPTVLNPQAKIVLSNLGTDGEHDWLTISSAGAMRWHGGAYAHNGYRPVFDASGNITATVIQFSEVKTALAAADSSIGVNSQKITGLAAGGSSGEAVEYSQLGTAVNSAVSGTSGKVAKFTGTHVVGDSTISDDGTNVSITGSFTAGTGGFIGVSLNRATSGTFTLLSNITTLAGTALAVTGIASIASTGSDIAITPDASYQLVVRRDGIGTNLSAGLSARNATAATSGQQQYGGALLSEGSGWSTSAGGSAKTVRGGHITKVASSSTPIVTIQTVYDQGGGSLGSGDYWTTQDPGLGGQARVVGTLIVDTSGSGVRSSANGNGGLKFPGTDTMVTSGGSNAVGLATNSTWRLQIVSTGATTLSPDDAVENQTHWAANATGKTPTL